MFKEYEIEDRIFLSLDRILKYINSRGKFEIVGWAERGEVMDQRVSQPNNGLHSTAAKDMVQSGTLNDHITKLEPMTPSVLNHKNYETLMFNLETGFTVHP